VSSAFVGIGLGPNAVGIGDFRFFYLIFEEK
jgi:hypothetical protein